jgi:hypothetical protein
VSRKLQSLIALLVVIVLAMTACSTSDSITENLKSSADGLEDQINQSREDVDARESEYEASLDTEQYRFIADYSAEERHANRFDQARAALDEANDVRENRVNDLTDGYKSEERQELADAVNDAERHIAEAQRLAEDPAQWLDLVVATRDDSDGTVAEAEAAATAVAENSAAIESIVATSKENFPQEASRFNELTRPYTDLQQQVAQAIPSLQTEAAKPEPNYAVMTEFAELARHGQETTNEGLTELNTSETQTLIDVRVDSSVVIGRTSWDDYADYPTEHEHIYEPREVSPEVADHFAQLAGRDDGKLAKMNNSDELDLEDDVDADHWDALNIDKKENWVDGDDESELWLSEVVDVPCHQILRLVNGEPDSSARPDPESNPCSGYDTQADLADGIYWEEGDGVRTADVGMDIYSKARGLFNEQATEAASPPGMAYVGDPETGEWREDENGN